MANAHQLSRACREPGYSPPGPSDPEPPTFITVPTTCARSAVRQLHTLGSTIARQYLADSKVGEWVDHENASMASGARNVIDGFDWYVAQDETDGRRVRSLDGTTVVTLGTIPLDVRLDVVLNDGPDLAGRAVLWDGPDFDPAEAPLIACAFAHGLQALHPGRNVTTIGVWQARRQRLVEVPLAAALAQTAAASAILANM